MPAVTNRVVPHVTLGSMISHMSRHFCCKWTRFCAVMKMSTTFIFVGQLIHANRRNLVDMYFRYLSYSHTDELSIEANSVDPERTAPIGAV